MANQSIFAAFERMWQHIVAALGNKADISHVHNDATQTESGFLSADDKINLDSLKGVDIGTSYTQYDPSEFDYFVINLSGTDTNGETYNREITCNNVAIFENGSDYYGKLIEASSPIFTYSSIFEDYSVSGIDESALCYLTISFARYEQNDDYGIEVNKNIVDLSTGTINAPSIYCDSIKGFKRIIL